MQFTRLYNKYKNTKPLTNPITFQLNEKYKGPILGNNGKIYLKRKRMNDGIYVPHNNIHYAVPAVWERPFGFQYDGLSCWITNSELLALSHYKKYKNAQNHLKKKWEKVIEKENKLYELSSALDCDVELPNGLKDNFIPRPHQKVGILYSNMSDNNYIMILDGMRSGKTYTSLLLSHSKGYKTILIVCPAMVKDVWYNAIKTLFINSNINILNSYDDIMNNHYNICNYDIIHTIKANVDCCILDESHYLIKKNARRTNGVMDIKSKFKIAMSGTPILNSPDEILPVLEWLDNDLYKQIKIFLSAYDDKYLAAKDLSRELRSKCAIQRKTSKLSFGGKTFTNNINIDCHLPDNASLQEVAESKIPYAVDYVKNYDKEKIIVAVQHLNIAKKLASSIGSEAVVITGETPDKIRDSIQKAFKLNKRVLIGSSAISEGLDFSFSSRILMLESGYSYRTEQLRKRAEKVGKIEPISVDILISNHPKDERVMEILNDKYEMNNGFNN